MGFNTGGEIKRGRNFTPAQFIIAAVLFTALTLLGIKAFMGSGSADVKSAGAGSAANPFKDDSPARTSGYNPAARSESMPSTGSVDLFAKTNAGYAGAEADEQAASTSAARNPADELGSPAGAALKNQAGGALPAAATAPAARRATVIPRLQPVKSFGTGASVGSGKMPRAGGGAHGADISAIVNGAMKDAEKKNSSGR